MEKSVENPSIITSGSFQHKRSLKNHGDCISQNQILRTGSSWLSCLFFSFSQQTLETEILKFTTTRHAVRASCFIKWRRTIFENSRRQPMEAGCNEFLRSWIQSAADLWRGSAWRCFLNGGLSSPWRPWRHALFVHRQLVLASGSTSSAPSLPCLHPALVKRKKQIVIRDKTFVYYSSHYRIDGWWWGWWQRRRCRN